MIIGTILFLVLIIYIITQLFYLYRSESKRKRLVQTNLIKERRFLRLAMEGGNTYAWRLENGVFILKMISLRQIRYNRVKCLLPNCYP